MYKVGIQNEVYNVASHWSKSEEFVYRFFFDFHFSIYQFKGIERKSPVYLVLFEI